MVNDKNATIVRKIDELLEVSKSFLDRAEMHLQESRECTDEAKRIINQVTELEGELVK